MIKVGIVGHRYLRNEQTVAFVSEQCLAILQQARARHESVSALSALAEGADTLFAEAAIKLGLPLEVVRPFKDYADDFITDSALDRYNKLLAMAVKETKLMYKVRSKKAYVAAMRWIVERSDILVVVWDGLPASGAGGTGDAVKQAIKLKRIWVHLHATNLTVTFHNAGQI